jgi:hypothetical protein
MALTIRNLVPLSTGRPGKHDTTAALRGGAFTVFLYATEDAAADVDTAGYFNDARHILRQGDAIWRLTINSSGVPQTMGFHLVNSVPATGNVDVADALAITTTDTD